jgi:hypothetical protein
MVKGVSRSLLAYFVELPRKLISCLRSETVCTKRDPYAAFYFIKLNFYLIGRHVYNHEEHKKRTLDTYERK